MTTHLLAATVTALIAVCLTWLLRHRSAALRHALLFAALLAFVVPTPWLNRAGDKLAACFETPAGPSFPGLQSMRLLSIETIVASHPESHFVRNSLWAAWALVFVLSLAIWLRRFLRTVPSIREPNSIELQAFARTQAILSRNRNIELSITAPDRVPGAVGVWRPRVVLPDLLSDQLSEPELDAVLAHELAHIVRRDNLSAAVARVVAAAFWFHPLAWWLERRMLAEREGACDELVLAYGAERSDYVSAILKVCRMSFTDTSGFAGTPGYAGATGSNLPKRIEQIMSAHVVCAPSRFLRAIPIAILGLAAILPVGEGFLQGQVVSPAAAPPTSTTHSANDAAAQRAYDCFKDGKFQEAEALYRQLYIQDPEDSRGFIGLTESYMAEGRSSDAVELLQQELAKQPSRTEVRIALANLYVRTEQFESAIDEFKRCLDEAKTQPERADVLYKLGETYRRKGDLNEAIRLFRAAADANPHDARWLLQVALMFDGTGRPEQAAPIYEEILKIQPDNPVALNDLAYILTQKGTDPDRAILLSQRAAQFAKESPEIHDTVGWAYLKKNQSDEAIAEFRKALQSTPNNPKFQFHLAMALLQIGERSAAIQELRAALANHPSKDDEREIRDLLSKIAD